MADAARSENRGAPASFVYRWFTDPRTRGLYPEDEHDVHSAILIADLRAASARRDSKDTEVTGLISQLTNCSVEFAEIWQRHDVALRRNERKRIVHHSLGIVELNCLNLFSEDGRQRLLWFTPAVGTDSADKLKLLAVIGVQQLVET